jgi:hypothetical protein
MQLTTFPSKNPSSADTIDKMRHFVETRKALHYPNQHALTLARIISGALSRSPSQLQDVGFVFLNILIGRGDTQIADDGGGWTSAFLGHSSNI